MVFRFNVTQLQFKCSMFSINWMFTENNFERRTRADVLVMSLIWMDCDETIYAVLLWLHNMHSVFLLLPSIIVRRASGGCERNHFGFPVSSEIRIR